MPVSAPEIWWPCRALAASGISVSSSRGIWDFAPLPSGAAATRKSSRRTWGHTFTLILLSRLHPRQQNQCKLAEDLGAHVYIDSAVEDATAVLQRMGGARAILATAPSGRAMGPLVSGLAARGKLIIVGD